MGLPEELQCVPQTVRDRVPFAVGVRYLHMPGDAERHGMDIASLVLSAAGEDRLTVRYGAGNLLAPVSQQVKGLKVASSCTCDHCPLRALPRCDRQRRYQRSGKAA